MVDLTNVAGGEEENKLKGHYVQYVSSFYSAQSSQESLICFIFQNREVIAHHPSNPNFKLISWKSPKIKLLKELKFDVIVKKECVQYQNVKYIYDIKIDISIDKQIYYILRINISFFCRTPLNLLFKNENGNTYLSLLDFFV